VRLALALLVLAAGCGHKKYQAAPSCFKDDSPIESEQCDLCLRQNYCTVITNCDDDGCSSDDYDHAALITAENSACFGVCDNRSSICGGFKLDDDSCDACLQSTCCGFATACAFDDICLSLAYQCLGKQHDTATACEATLGVFGGVLEGLTGCLQSSCPGCIPLR